MGRWRRGLGGFIRGRDEALYMLMREMEVSWLGFLLRFVLTRMFVW